MSAAAAGVYYPETHPLVNRFSPPSASGPGGPLLASLHIDIDTIAYSISGRLVNEFNWPAKQARVIRAFLEYVRDHSNLAWPGIPTLARRANVSDSTVKRASRKLRGLIVCIGEGLFVAGLRVVGVEEREPGPGPHRYQGKRLSPTKRNTNTYDLSVLAYLLPAPLVAAFRAWLHERAAVLQRFVEAADDAAAAVVKAAAAGQNLPFVVDTPSRRRAAAAGEQNLSSGSVDASGDDCELPDPFSETSSASATGLGSAAKLPPIATGYGGSGAAPLSQMDRGSERGESSDSAKPEPHLSTARGGDGLDRASNLPINRSAGEIPEAKPPFAPGGGVTRSTLTHKETREAIQVLRGPGWMALASLRVSATLRDQIIAEKTDAWAFKLVAYCRWMPGLDQAKLAGYARRTFEKFENWDLDFERWFAKRYPETVESAKARRPSFAESVDNITLGAKISAALGALPASEREELLSEAMRLVGGIWRRAGILHPGVQSKAYSLLLERRRRADASAAETQFPPIVLSADMAERLAAEAAELDPLDE